MPNPAGTGLVTTLPIAYRLSLQLGQKTTQVGHKPLPLPQMEGVVSLGVDMQS